MHVENSIMINRPIEEVFEYVCAGLSQAPEDIAGSDARRHDYPGGPEVPRTDVEGHLLGGYRVRATDRRSLSSDLRSSLWCCCSRLM